MNEEKHGGIPGTYKGREIRVTFSDDKEFNDIIRSSLKKNDGYCPCRAVKTKDTKCMCKAFRDQIEAGIPGPCHCGLYVITITED